MLIRDRNILSRQIKAIEARSIFWIVWGGGGGGGLDLFTANSVIRFAQRVVQEVSGTSAQGQADAVGQGHDVA